MTDTSYGARLARLENAERNVTIVVPEGVTIPTLPRAQAGTLLRNDGRGDGIPWEAIASDSGHILGYVSSHALADAGLDVPGQTPAATEALLEERDLTDLTERIESYLIRSAGAACSDRAVRIVELVRKEFGLKPLVDLSNARVIEGTDDEGDLRTVVRSFSSEYWVSDAGSHWDEDRLLERLTDIKVLLTTDA